MINASISSTVSYVNVEELELSKEMEEILAMPGIKEEIKESKQQIKKGDFTSLSALS